jgi:hypothetical protein
MSQGKLLSGGRSQTIVLLNFATLPKADFQFGILEETLEATHGPIRNFRLW